MKFPFKNPFKGKSLDDLEDFALTTMLISTTVLVVAASLLILCLPILLIMFR